MNLPKLPLPWKHSYVKRSENDRQSLKTTNSFQVFFYLPNCTYAFHGWFEKAIYPSIISTENYPWRVGLPWAVQQVGAIVNRLLQTRQRRWYHTRNGKDKAVKCCHDSLSFHQFNEKGPSQLVIPLKMESIGSTGDQKKRGSRQPGAKLEIRGSFKKRFVLVPQIFFSPFFLINALKMTRRPFVCNAFVGVWVFVFSFFLWLQFR